MMCDKCGKNPATTIIRTVVNGVMNESNLCAYCAAKEGYGDFYKLSLSNMLASMFGDSIKSIAAAKKRCPCCNATFSDIVESGSVGCSKCYDTFREELMPSLLRLHGKSVHIGKTPEISYVKSEDKNEVENEPAIKKNSLQSLKDDLKKAISEERFEDAAKLRDEIKDIESKENKELESKEGNKDE